MTDICTHLYDVTKQYNIAPDDVEIYLPNEMYFSLYELMRIRTVEDRSGQYTYMKINGITIRRKET
jgi:hypothetical protein